MTIDLTNKPIAITGASSGIGRATAIACARAGMPVVLAARRLDKLERVVAEIRAINIVSRDGQTTKGRAIAVETDVTKPEDCARLIDRTVAEFGSIYSVFANAGYGYEKAVLDTPEAEIREIFETNFWGTLNTIRPAIAAMRKAGPANEARNNTTQPLGHVLICTSSVAKIGVPYLGMYSATKAAQDHLGRSMRHELHGTGIHVSTVHPIGTRTELWEVLEKRSGGKTKFSSRTPASFMQPPERVAKAVVKCLHKPRGEVWTSLPTRVVLGLSVVFPGITDALFGMAVGKVQKRATRE